MDVVGTASQGEGFLVGHLLASLAASITFIQAQPVPPATCKPILPLAFYFELGSRETGKGFRDAEGKYWQPPRWDYNRNGYTGAFGTYKGTAAMFGYKNLHTLPARQQACIFDIMAFLGNPQHKPIGVNGWGAIRSSKELQQMIRASKHPATKGWKFTK